MSEDTREAILERLEAIGLQFAAAEHVFRNQIDIPEKARPAWVVLDGDEDTEDGAWGKGRPANGPLIVSMRPELFIMLDAGSEKVGPALSAFRRRVIKTILTDSTLVDLALHGDIRYEGMVTGFAVGRSIEAEAGFSFSFRYLLRPDRL